jgi:phytoene desaturase
MTSVLIIGAGTGGITAAAMLARQGYHVTVVEKNAHPGGRCDRFVQAGHHFDTGPTLFLMPEIVEQVFDFLGQRVEDHLALRRVDPAYHVDFGDGTHLTLTSDLAAMQADLEAIESGSTGSFLRYLAEGRRHYELVFAHLLGRNFRHAWEYFTPKNMLLISRLKALRRHYDNLERYFADPRLRVAFSFQDMYVGLSPYQAPATYSLLPYAEMAGGVWFPSGGMYQLIEALTAIAQEAGARFLFDAPVAEIDVDGKQATGVTLADGRKMPADVVLANADLPYVYHQLLPDGGPARRLDRKAYTCSTVTFCWGIDRQYHQLGPHSLFLARDFRQGMDQIFCQRTLPDEPSFYLHAPARIDATMAPEGHDTLTAVVPVGHIDETAPQDWAQIRQRARLCVLQRLAQAGVADLENHIKFEASYTPPDWQSRYNLAKGASFGLSHTFLQMGYLRPGNRHARYRNLYFVGASTHPGAGLPTVLLSAGLATERILEEVGVPRSAHAGSGPSIARQRAVRT